MPVISQREAARRAGISRPAIKKHLDAGRIVAVGDKVDVASFDLWIASRIGRQPATAVSLSLLGSVDSPAAENARAALALVDQDGVFETRAEAERHRDSFIARLRQIEFDLKSGSVVECAEMARRVGEEYARVRTRMLAIPAEQAPQLHRCKTVTQLQDLLLSLITRALEELSLDAKAA